MKGAELDALKEIAGAIRVLADAQRRTKGELARIDETLISIDRSLKRMRPDRKPGEVIFAEETVDRVDDPTDDDRK